MSYSSYLKRLDLSLPARIARYVSRFLVLEPQKKVMLGDYITGVRDVYGEWNPERARLCEGCSRLVVGVCIECRNTSAKSKVVLIKRVA